MKSWHQHNFSPLAATMLDQLQETRKQYWNIHPDAAQVLAALILSKQPQKILEIGTSNGYSAILMGDLVARHTGTVTTIELFDERISLAKQHIQAAGLTNVIIQKGDARDLVKTLPSGWDFVFMDAGKRDYLHFFEHIFPKLNSGGIIVADNTLSHRKEMKTFIDAIEQSNFPVLEIPVGDGVIVIKKQP